MLSNEMISKTMTRYRFSTTFLWTLDHLLDPMTPSDGPQVTVQVEFGGQGAITVRMWTLEGPRDELTADWVMERPDMISETTISSE